MQTLCSSRTYCCLDTGKKQIPKPVQKTNELRNDIFLIFQQLVKLCSPEIETSRSRALSKSIYALPKIFMGASGYFECGRRDSTERGFVQAAIIGEIAE